MKVLILPFYDQQDKVLNVHLPTASAIKMLSFIAERIVDELGWDVTTVVPEGFRSPAPGRHLASRVPTDNRCQRVHCDAEFLRHALDGIDLVIAQHEYMASPVRWLKPDVGIVQLCTMDPEELLLFRASWDAADLVVVLDSRVQRLVQEWTSTDVVPWNLDYDERLFAVERPAVRDIDVLYVMRCHSNDSDYHSRFLERMPAGRVVFTDVTHYLKQRRPDLEYSDAAQYIGTLFRSKVVVALRDSYHGGNGVREAVRAGCVPVMLRGPTYRHFAGADWPFFCTLDDIPEVCSRALAAVDVQLPDVKYCSYQAAWLAVRDDLLRVADARMRHGRGSTA